MTTYKIKIPPISTRMHEGFSSKNTWLGNYYEFRRYNSESESLKFDAKRLLSSMGKNNSDLACKFRGCFLGLAVGDAFGTTLEFTARRDTEKHTEMIGQGPYDLKPGQWTDDTSMALCLAHSLYDKYNFDPKHQMELYTLWWKEGFLSSNGHCFDIGNTVRDALERFSNTGVPYSGSDDEYSAGNGALMRLAPVVMYYASNHDKAIEMAGLSSKTTHGNVQSVDACRYYSALILGAFKGDSKETILADMYSPQGNYWTFFPLCDQIKRIADGSYKNKTRDMIESSGYVVHSMEAALWAFYHTSTFEEGLIKAVNLGGDADTIGAIYGQLAGAYYGEYAIPFKFISPLSNFHYFYFFAEEFVMLYSGRNELLAFDRKQKKE